MRNKVTIKRHEQKEQISIEEAVEESLSQIPKSNFVPIVNIKDIELENCKLVVQRLISHLYGNGKLTTKQLGAILDLDLDSNILN